MELRVHRKKKFENNELYGSVKPTEISKLIKEENKIDIKPSMIQPVFEIKNLETGTLMSRAFKPMPVVLDLVYENFSKYKNLIFFMGKSGKKIFEKSKNDWDLEYIEKKSLTNEDSFLLNIKKISKKNKKRYKKN